MTIPNPTARNGHRQDGGGIAFIGVPAGSRPSCYDLLSRKTRETLKLYSKLGYVGIVITEAMAYIDLLEAEIVRLESR